MASQKSMIPDLGTRETHLDRTRNLHTSSELAVSGTGVPPVSLCSVTQNKTQGPDARATISRFRLKVLMHARMRKSDLYERHADQPTPSPSQEGNWLRFLIVLLLGTGQFALLGADTTTLVVDGLGADALEPIKSRVAGAVSNAYSEASSANAAEVASMDLLDDKQNLGAGDRVSFRIVEDGDEPKEILVSDSGELEIPYLGRTRALGRTCKELATEIKARLEKEFYYEATVILAVDQLNRSRGKVYLVGQVRGAGPQDIPSDEEFTLSKAILRAGGFSDFADRKRVRI